MPSMITRIKNRIESNLAKASPFALKKRYGTARRRHGHSRRHRR